MAKNPRRNVRTKFVFLSLTSEQVGRLKEAIDPSLLKIEQGEGLEGKNCVQVLRLDEGICKRIISFLETENIGENLHRLYSSIVSERDHDGFRLPDYAVKLVRAVGGYVDFAFISTRGTDSNPEESVHLGQS